MLRRNRGMNEIVGVNYLSILIRLLSVRYSSPKQR